MDIVTYDRLNLKNSVVALGKFQGLHRGHMLLIDEVLRISSQNHFKGVVLTINMREDKVINLSKERYSLLEDMGIDVVAECEFTKAFASMTPEIFVKSILIDRLGATCVVVGSDFRFGCKRQGDVELLKSFGDKYGFDVVAFGKLTIDGKVVSTSYIRELIYSGEVSLVNKFMGRPYMLSGKVLRGKQLGRTIGFPTANILPCDLKLLPPFGAYYTKVIVDDKEYKAITNIGNNPTVNDSNLVTVESHLFDYDGELYDKDITVMFMDFIREEKKFISVDELKNQLILDKNFVLHQ